jgi:PII-like signaling protein
VIADALKLSVYFGDGVAVGSRPSAGLLVDCLARHGIVCALLRGIEGFGLNRRLHAERFPDVSTDLPLLVMAADRSERIRAVLDDVDAAVPRGLVTLEHARLATGADVARADIPPGPGRAAKLTVFCGGRRPAHRTVVDILRRTGASGAIVLAGVDGVLGGRRRERLFRNGGAPMVVISVGSADVLRRALAPLAAALPDVFVTLEPIALVKHDGELLEPPPSPADVAGRDVWQTIRVYTRRSAQAGGAALFDELTRRLRERGAAGATTVLGEWGFSSDEHPYGDRFGRIASHRPTYSVYIDRVERVAENWAVIDELTAEHGIVTSLIVPGYRERAGETVRGRLI